MLSEYWVGELILMAAAKLPSPEATLSALAIYQLANTTCYQMPGGLRMAASARVGQALGAARPHSARRAVLSCFALVTLYMPLPATLFLGFTRHWAHVFTDDAEVVRQLVALAPWLVTYVTFDALLGVSNGALAGSGQQLLGGRLALLSYILISLPAALALGFGAHAGAVGLMSGHAAGRSSRSHSRSRS